VGCGGGGGAFDHPRDFRVRLFQIVQRQFRVFQRFAEFPAALDTDSRVACPSHPYPRFLNTSTTVMTVDMSSPTHCDGTVWVATAISQINRDQVPAG
jgi:hypothetical protein